MRAVARMLAAAVPSLAVATIAVGFLQNVAGVPNASAVYLVAVVVTALVAGTWGAIVAAVASFLLYDFLFVHPLYTLTVGDPGEWLNLVLLLFVGIVVGQLAALQRSRAEIAAGAREREARDAVPGQPSARDPRVDADGAADRRRRSCARRRRWTASGSRSAPDDAGERVAADTGPASEARRSPGLYYVLQRMPGRHARPVEPRPPAGPGRAAAAGAARGATASGSRRRGATVRLDLGHCANAIDGEPDRRRRGCCPRPPTRSARRSPRTGSPPRRRPPRSPARATRSSRRCCSRSRTTSGRRWRRSARPPARSARAAA